MKEENRKYAREAMDIVEHAAHKIGSRLPGSDGEIKLHKYMGEKLRESESSQKQRNLQYLLVRVSAVLAMQAGRRNHQHRCYYCNCLRI